MSQDTTRSPMSSVVKVVRGQKRLVPDSNTLAYCKGKNEKQKKIFFCIPAEICVEQNLALLL